MTDDAGEEYAVPVYRDPEKTARIVEARRRGDRVTDIAAREGLSRQRVSKICRDAGLAVGRRTADPEKPCARAGCGKLLRNRLAVYCSRECAAAARHPNPFGKRFYERRRDSEATWREIADAAPPDWRPDLFPGSRARAASVGARRYAEAHGLPWPLPDRAAAERIARRDEEGMAEVRETVERERRVLALLDTLPRDRTISRDEAERFLVELYRTGMTFHHIAERTKCSWKYAKAVVRRRAPELMRSRSPRKKRTHRFAPLLDFSELRKAWRAERFLDARMLAAYLAGESLADISRREKLHRDAVWKRISAASPEPLP